MTRLAALAAVAVVILTGCGSHPALAHKAAAPSSPAAPATSAPPGPQRFIAEVRAAGFGNKDITTAPVQALLSIGNSICGGMSVAHVSGLAGYSRYISSLMKNHAHPTLRQVTVWVDSAIRNLCPDNSNMMPSGAP